jgi:hypothetical protein
VFEALVVTPAGVPQHEGSEMIKTYFLSVLENLRRGAHDESGRPGPRVLSVALIVAAAVSVYIVVSIFVVPPTMSADFNFINERGSITALSAFFLAIGSGFALVAFCLSQSAERNARLLWLIVFVVLAFVALDELLEFHERVGKQLDKIVDISAMTSGAVRRWNDIIVALYGIAAIPAGFLLLPTIARYRAFLVLVAAAFCMFCLHTVVDSVTEPPTYYSVIVEESAKLYCSMCLSLACLFGLFAQVGLSLPQSSPASRRSQAAASLSYR